MNARFELIGKLLADLVVETPAERRDFASVVAETIGAQVDRIVEAARQTGFTQGVASAEAARHPDAELETLRRRGDEAVQGMLDAFVQMQSVTKN